MAIKLPKIFTAKDAKSRLFVVVTVVVAFSVIIFFAVSFFGGGNPSGATKVATAPNLQTVPGGSATPEFYQAVVQANTL